MKYILDKSLKILIFNDIIGNEVMNVRRFLYLNIDSIYSYISQLNDGLPTKITSVNMSEEEKDKQIKSNIGANANADFKIFDKGLDADLNTNIGDKVSRKTINQDSNSIEKKIYDEAFDKLNQHLINNKFLNKKEKDIGDFIEIHSEMFIVDLEYYKHIFSNNDVLDFIKNSEVENKFAIESSKIEENGNGNKAKYDKDKLKKDIAKQVDLEYKGIEKIINAILNIVPYNKFGIMGDCLIVLDDEYFRDKTKVVAFKYGGKMTMLGYLTNIVNNMSSYNENNAFATFPTLINSFMLSFFNKNEIKIIHPIAIYY